MPGPLAPLRGGRENASSPLLPQRGRGTAHSGVEGVLRAKALFAFAFALTAAHPTLAQTISEKPDAIAVTLYRNDAVPSGVLRGRGLALITERRTIALPAGPAVISFRGVADTLVPQTAQVQGLPEPLTESNFDYSLLSPGTLIARSMGQPVRLVRTAAKTGVETSTVGVLRSGPQGVVVDEGGGRVEALHCSGAPERLVFDRVPPGLSDKPTLSVRTNIPQAGTYALTLSYLATGFDWSADYVARLNPDGRTLSLSGWLTLKNASRTGFSEASTGLVAGRVAQTGKDVAVAAPILSVLPNCWDSAPWWSLVHPNSLRLQELILTAKRALAPPPMAIPAVAMAAPAPPPPPPPPPMAKESNLGDYKLYTLPEPTTVAANQTKQVRFLDQPKATYTRVYAYRLPTLFRNQTDYPPQDDRTRIVLRLLNAKAQGLGKSLPSGRVAVLATHSGQQPLFAGSDRLDDTAEGAALKLTLGRSSQVRVRAKIISSTVSPVDNLAKRVGLGPRQTVEIEAVAANAGSEPEKVEVRQPALRDLTVLKEDQAHDLEAGEPRWTLTVPAGGEAGVHFTVRFQT